MPENENIEYLQYREKVYEYAKKIIDEKDYEHLTRILINYDISIRKQYNLFQLPNFPFWDVCWR